MSTIMTASNQWASRPSDQRYETLDALRESVAQRRMRSRSVDIDFARIGVTSHSGHLVINSQIKPCEPSHWAFGQFAASVKAPAAYLRTLPMPLVVDCLTHGLKNSERETGKFMTIASETDAPNTLQAVTSTKYGRIWDADVVDSVVRIVERSGGKFHNPLAYAQGGGTKPSGLYASDHDVFMFLIDGGSILEAGPRAKLNRGFIVWNSETGARTFGLMTFLFNQCCGNHIIWGAQDVNKLIIRHTGGGPYRFDSEAMPTLKSYSEASAQPLLATVKRAQDYLLYPVEQSKAVVEGVSEFCERNTRTAKFTRSEISSAIDFAKSEEGECRTLWQLVQGLTAYARGFDYIDARVDLEKRAGALLNIVAREV